MLVDGLQRLANALRTFTDDTFRLPGSRFVSLDDPGRLLQPRAE
jgi:hypothetical protein